MTERRQIYKCNVCGSIVEVLHSGVGRLVCCGKPMELLVEKTEEAGGEKHVPVVERTEAGIKVKVGSVPHPGDTPEAEFPVQAEEIEAREHCSIHGLWKSR